MKTIKEITTAFKAAEQYEAWMDAFKVDERASIQKAIQSFEKRMEKKAQIKVAHEENLSKPEKSR